MKRTILYLLNIILLFIVGYSILPDFSLDEKKFKKVSGLISEVRLETFEEKRPKKYFFNNLSRERLIMTIADRNYHEYYISDIYEMYWDDLLDSRNVGKKVVLYLGIGHQQEDPFRIDINNQMIFGPDVRFKRNILIILFTLSLSIYNLFNYFKSHTRELEQVERKFAWIKHNFLNRKSE